VPFAYPALAEARRIFEVMENYRIYDRGDDCNQAQVSEVHEAQAIGGG
jgi:hypothetical protein